MAHTAETAEICCVCLTSSVADEDTSWLNIYNDFSTEEGRSLLNLIEEVTGEVGAPNEGLPGQICPACLATAKIAFHFKRRYLRNLQSFRVQQSNTKTHEDWPQVKQENSITSEEDLEYLNCENEEPEGNAVNDLEQELSCIYCLRIFTRKFNLDRHLQTCLRPFKCPQCPKAFAEKAYLDQHMCIHTGDRPFQCSHCSKSFKLHGHLKQHLRGHTGERPFKCHQCPKAFTRKSSLEQHLNTHTGDKPYQCTECTKAFSLKSNLEYHLRKHIEVRPLKCTECSRSFILSSHLKQHMLTHTGERPHQCSQCEKSFTRKSVLEQHLATHSKMDLDSQSSEET